DSARMHDSGTRLAHLGVSGIGPPQTRRIAHLLYSSHSAENKVGGSLMPGKAAKVVISERQQEVLRKFSNATTVAKSLSKRADIILQAFEGQDNETIADRVGLERHSIGIWRRRWQRAFDQLVKIECLEPPAALRHAIEKVLADEPRSGCPGTF